MSGLGQISVFDYNTADWQIFLSRLKQFIKLNKIDAENQSALLLTHLSDETYKLARNLLHPRNIEEVTFDDLVTELNRHFSPKRCNFADRAKFYEASRAGGESVEAWAARLRGLAILCDFGSELEVLLRDRFVLGMSAGPERDRLFETDAATITFSKAVELAQQAACARQARAAALPDQARVKQELQDAVYHVGDARAGRPGGGGGGRGAPGRGAPPSPRGAYGDGPCEVCGLKSHSAEFCRYKKYKCQCCGKKGHLKKVCNERKCKSSRLNHISEDKAEADREDSGSECEECKMFNLRPTYWGQRTSFERRLLVVSAVASVLAVAFLAAFVATLLLRPADTNSLPQTSQLRRPSSSHPASFGAAPAAVGKDNDDVCSEPACIHTASKLLSNMNDQADPCDDFYDFACGSFLENTRIPDDKMYVTTLSIITDRLQKQILSLLDEPVTATESRPFVLAKTLYQACMNKTVIEARGTKPLLEMLRRLGGWPVLDEEKWDEEDFNWKDSVYRLRKAGYPVDYFMDFSISVDVKNSTKRIIGLDQASLGLGQAYLNRRFINKLVPAYYSYMVDIAQLLGADKTRAETELWESLKFEIQLANITLPLKKRRNATLLYNPMTIAEMQRKFPSIPWLEYINQMLAPHLTVGLDEVIIVKVPQYITDLENLLRTTPKRVQANYVMWRVAGASVSYLTEELRRREMAYLTAVYGKTERESRSKECADFTSAYMYIAVGALYIRKYFNEDSKANALEMVNDIRQQFRKTLEEVEWMDEQTRSAALHKADSMASHIAYPSEMLDDNKLTEFYSGLELSSDKLMESMLNVTLFFTEYMFSMLREPVNKSDWISHGYPTIVNAFYSFNENSIQFPAGILQGALFSANRPAFMNYGAIGFFIGHEIVHGFDDQGSQFDNNGNLVDWWQEMTKLKYLEKIKCIIDQYSNYTVKEVGLKLNGVITQGENIADNGGIKKAYFAYQAWTQRHGQERRLPGLEKYSPKQLFWLSAANTWCSVYRNEAMKMQIMTDNHSPDRFRIVGPLSNMEEFASDFHCPLGSPMNPPHKCKVW